MDGTRSIGSVDARLHVAVITERQHQLLAQPRGAARALGRAGHDVAVLAIEDVLAPWDPITWSGYDVVLGRGRGDALLTALRAAEEAGALVLNTSAAIAAVREQLPAAVPGDVRVCGVGGQLHTVRLPREGASGPATGGALPTDPAVARLAVGAAAAYGLELFAVEMVLGTDGPVVTAVADFPDYSGVAGCDELLAAYVVARSRAETRVSRRLPARVSA